MAMGYPGSGLAERLRRMQGGQGMSGATAPATPLVPTLPQPAQMARRPPHLDPQHLASRLANQDFRRQQATYGQFVLPALRNLQTQANTDHFSDQERAATLGPHVDALDQQYSQAQGNLSRQLAERGLSSSSAMASGLGALAGGEATAHAGLVSDLYEREKQRQMAAQQGLLSASTGLYGQQSGQAGSLAMQLQQLLLQKKQIDQAGKFDWAGLLSGLGSAAGAAGAF